MGAGGVTGAGSPAGGVTAPGSERSACQYRRVTSLLARATMPLAASTLCFVEVTLFRFADALSLMTGVPRPAGKTGLSIAADFS